MQERLKQIWNKVLAWWKKFSMKQRILIVSIVGVILLSLGMLAFVVSRPTMVTLKTCESVTEASSVKKLLDEASIKYEIMEDNLTFKINKKDMTNATYILGTNQIASDEYSLEDVFNGSFSTTEADKNKKYQLYLEQKLGEQLEGMDTIKSASVSLSIPLDDGTIIAKNEETYACVVLKLDGKMGEEKANGIAKFIATAVGNKGTDSITLLDSDSNVLFAGGEESTAIGAASTQLAMKAKTENMVKGQISDVVLGTNVYDNVAVGLNLDLDFDKISVDDLKYYVEEGKDQGYLDSESAYESETTGGGAAVPGTDSNDDTTYVLENGNGTSSTISDVKKDYLPNQARTITEKALGAIKYDSSSVSVVATKYVVYDEDLLKSQGKLDKMTFDEFKAKNSARKQVKVSDDFYKLVENATGFSKEKISIIAYEVPFFEYSSGSGRTAMDYLEIILAVVIFALLGYVVFRSTRKDKGQVLEPELSDESLLQSTKASLDMEEIGYNEKSEIRILIEKFVEEKPEAVASLLRNWLEEEWN